MYSRLFTPPAGKSFFLFGPRGTGKTYLIKGLFPNSLYFDLLDTAVYLDFNTNPDKLESSIPPSFADWIILDEVQRIPELLNEVHRLIENKRYKFILTGSSARSLKRKGVNLLAGRALTCRLFPLTCLELGKDFNLEHALAYGMLPATFSEESPGKYLKAYVGTYLREEVLQEGLVRNIGSFARFLEISSFSQASVLNVSEVAREAKIERKVVENYFSILEDLLLATTLPVFTKRAKRRLVGHSKFYLFDPGVFRAIRPMGPFDRPEEAEGAALETLVYQQLLALNNYLDFEYQFFYWRTSTQLEVDFILYGPKGLIAIEVKRSKTINASDLKCLEAFSDDYPEARLFCFYGGQRKEYFGKIQAIPLTEALFSLPSLLEK